MYINVYVTKVIKNGILESVTLRSSINNQPDDVVATSAFWPCWKKEKTGFNKLVFYMGTMDNKRTLIMFVLETV